MLAVWLNGKRMEQQVTLSPKMGQAIALPIPSPSRHLATYCFAICDPDEEVYKRDKTDNISELVLPPKGQSERVCAIVWNPTKQPLRNVPVTIVVGQRFDSLGTVVVRDADGNLLPAQADTKSGTLTVLLANLPPYSAITLWLAQRTVGATHASPLHRSNLIVFRRTKKGYEIKTDALRLVKDEPDGDAFDRIYLRSDWRLANSDWIELGSFTPLVWQVVEGQALWVRPDRVEALQTQEVGPARFIMDIIFTYGSGKFAPLKAESQPFRCAYRFTFFPDQPFFLAQCLWVENTGEQAWQWRGYYHYTFPRIGGETRDDDVGGPNVPNYWLLFASWRDPKLQVHYGVVPLQEDERLGIWFWKDEGGYQHPDCWRRLDGKMKPKERWQPKEPEPIVAVFGARETDENLRPWDDLVKTLRAWAKVKAKVF